MSVGHFKEASVCHMHYLAFCRELGDFVGITKAECNLGIAYTNLRLFRLAGRCFLQVAIIINLIIITNLLNKKDS